MAIKVKEIGQMTPVQLEDVMNEISSNASAKDSFRALKKFARPLIDAVNKRLKRLRNASYDSASQAYASIASATEVLKGGKRVKLAKKKGGLRISYAPDAKLGAEKNVELLKAKISKAYEFMFQDRDSTVGRVRAKYKQVERKLGIEFTSKKQASKFWKAFHILQESKGGRENFKAIHGYSHLSVQDAFEVWKENKRLGVEKLTEKMTDMYEGRIYADQESKFMTAEEIAKMQQLQELGRYDETDEDYEGNYLDGFAEMGDSKGF